MSSARERKMESAARKQWQALPYFGSGVTQLLHDDRGLSFEVSGIDLLTFKAVSRPVTAPQLPSWILGFYSDPTERAPRMSLKILITEMYKLLALREFSQINSILERVDWKRLPPEIVMGIPRASAVARAHLPSWESAVLSAASELDRRGLPSEKIMLGLLEKTNAASHPRAA